MKKEELGELIIASEDMMYHVAKTLLYRDADCADAIQETIVKAFSKLHTLKSDVYAKTWLTRILINECYTVMRKEKKGVGESMIIDIYPGKYFCRWKLLFATNIYFHQSMFERDRKSTRLNSSHANESRMPSSA